MKINYGRYSNMSGPRGHSRAGTHGLTDYFSQPSKEAFGEMAEDHMLQVKGDQHNTVGKGIRAHGISIK